MKINLINDGVSRPVDALITSRIRDSLDSELTLSFTLTEIDTPYINDKTIVQYGEQYFNVISYQKDREGQSPTCAVECEHVSYSLNDDEYKLEEFVYSGSAAGALAAVLSGTLLNAGTVEPAGTVNISLTGGTRKAILISVAAIIGGEIEYSGYTVNLRRHRGSAEYIELLGTDNVTDVSYSRDVLNGTTTYNIQLGRKTILSCGDNVHIKFTPLEIDVQTRITAIEYNPYNTHEVEIEVGDYVPDILDNLQKTQNKADTALKTATDTANSLSGYAKKSEVSATVDTYINSEAGRASIVASLSGTYVTESDLSGYVEKTTLSAEIGAYIDTQAGTAKIVNNLSGTFVTKNALGDYVQKTELSAGIESYIDTAAGTAKVVSAVSGTYVTQTNLNSTLGNYAKKGDIPDLTGYVQKTELSAEIGAYIDTQAGTAKIVNNLSGTFVTENALGDYVQKTELSAGIESYIDTAAGTAKVVSAVSGTYVTQSNLNTTLNGYPTTTQMNSALSSYAKTTNLNSSIAQYLDTASGQAAIVSAVEGEFITESDLTGYAKVTAVTAVEQSVSSVESKISLSATYGSGTIGSNVRALLTLVSNADSSNIKIKASAIEVSGTTTFLTASDLGASGTTVIDGGRIKTGTISADRIDTSSITLSDVYGKGTYANKLMITSSGDYMYIGSDITTTNGIYTSIDIRSQTLGFSNASIRGLVIDHANKVFRPNSTSSTGGYNLGTSSYQWNNLYVNKIYINGTELNTGTSSSTNDRIYAGTSTTYYIQLNSSKVFVASGTGFNLGSTTYPFQTLYIGTGYSYYWKFEASAILPSSTSTLYFDIGSSTYPVNNLYARKIYLNGTELTSGSSSSSGSNPTRLYYSSSSTTYYVEATSGYALVPSHCTSYSHWNLGSSSYYWYDCYLGYGSTRIGYNTSSKLGFFGTAPVVKQTVSSSATVATLITALKAYGLI